MLKFGLIGKSLVHSFSADFFHDLFKKRGVKACYENIEIQEIQEVKEIVHFKKYSGLNVTIPYKESIIPFLDELTDEATQIGAVNVIQLKNGKTIGHNTDAFGFKQSIKPFLTNQHEKALIIGTGGASKAIEYVLLSIGIECIFVSRNPAKKKHFSYSEVNEHMINACKLIINCTPTGTYPNTTEMPKIPIEFLKSTHLVIDLIYNPSESRLLKEAKQQGAMTLNGESMLKEQALKSFEIWNS